MAHVSHARSCSSWGPCALVLALLWNAAWDCAAARAQAPSLLSARLRLGAGVAQRLVDAPSDEGPRQLDFGPAPALMLGVDGQLRSDAWLLGLGLTYRSSVAGRVADTEAGPGASVSKTAVRSHNFEAGVRVGLHLGSRPQGTTLSLFAGYDVRAFSSVAVLRVPRFTLHGPVLRLEVELPLTAAHMRLRLAPEAQWIASFSSLLRNTSGIEGSGLALGAEAQLLLPLSDSLSLFAHYRESHAFAQGRAAQSFSDVERYLLLGAAFLVL